MPAFRDDCSCLKVLAVVEVHFNRSMALGKTDDQLREAIALKMMPGGAYTLSDGRTVIRITGGPQGLEPVKRIIREVPYAPAV